MADWQRIRADYDRSVLDWARLQAYARKVATEKGSADEAASWVLDTRYWHRTDRNHNGGSVTESATYQVLLLRDGSIVNQQVRWTETETPFWTSPEEVTRRPFAIDDVLQFDFDNPEYRRDGVATNRERGQKLLVHAKGVGLSKRLKALMTKPATQMVEPVRRAGVSSCCGAKIVRTFWGIRRCDTCGVKQLA